MSLKRTSCGTEDLRTIDSTYLLWTENRCRRSSEDCSSTSSGFSSCSSPEGIGLSRDGQVFFDQEDGSVLSSAAATHDQSRVTMVSRFHHNTSGSRVKLVFKVREESDKTCLRQIFKPFLDVIDPSCDVIRFVHDGSIDGGKWPLVLFGGCKDLQNRGPSSDVSLPPLGLVLLLQEEAVGADKLSMVSEYLQKPPWKFHHSEWVAAHRIKAYPYNSLDYFSIAEALPVCSVRQVHGGMEHLRIQRYVTHDHWQETCNFYRLLTMQDPEYHKSDFSVFTLSVREAYTIQFALKRLPPGIAITKPCHAVLSFQVTDVSSLLHVLPRDSHRISEFRWRTQDLDGNEIFIETQHNNPRSHHKQRRPKSRSRSVGSRRSSTSFASVLFDTAQEFIDAEESMTPNRGPSINGFPTDSGTSENTKYKLQHESPLSNGYVRSRSLSRSREDRRLVDTRDVWGYPPGPQDTNTHQHTDSGFAEDKSDEGEGYIPKLSSQVRGSQPCDVCTCRCSTPNNKSVTRRSRQMVHGQSEHSAERVMRGECAQEVLYRTSSPHLSMSKAGAFSPYMNENTNEDVGDVTNIRATTPKCVLPASTGPLSSHSDTNVPHRRKYFPSLGVGDSPERPSRPAHNQNQSSSHPEPVTLTAEDKGTCIVTRRRTNVPQSQGRPFTPDRRLRAGHVQPSLESKLNFDNCGQSSENNSFEEVPIDCPESPKAKVEITGTDTGHSKSECVMNMSRSVSHNVPKGDSLNRKTKPQSKSVTFALDSVEINCTPSSHPDTKAKLEQRTVQETKPDVGFWI